MDDDPLFVCNEWDTGDEDSRQTAHHLQEKVREAGQNGISDSGASELEALLKEYADIFRTKLGSGPLAKVPPMKITFLPGAKPFRARVTNPSTAY